MSPSESKPDLYNCKWEFTFYIRATRKVPVVFVNDGGLVANKVTLTDRGTKCKITVSGHLQGRPKFSMSTRQKVFNMSGYRQHPEPPQWLLDMVAEAGFARREI